MTTSMLLGFALLLGAIVFLLVLLRASAHADRTAERIFARDKRWLADAPRQRASSPPRLERTRSSERLRSHAAAPAPPRRR